MKTYLPSKGTGTSLVSKLGPADVLNLAKNGVEIAGSVFGYLSSKEETKRAQIASEIEITHSNNESKEVLAKLSLAKKQLKAETKKDELASKERLECARMSHKEKMKKLDTLEKLILSKALNLDNESSNKVLETLLR